MAIDAALGRLGIKEGVCTSSTRPANPFEGQLIYETDTNRTLVYDNAAWLVVADNQVLSIDSANGRVGVNDTSPSYALDVTGDINATNLRIGGTEYANRLGGGAAIRSLGSFVGGDVLQAAELNAIGTWTTYTPTLTNWTASATSFSYLRINNIMFVRIYAVVATMGTFPDFTLPVASQGGPHFQPIGLLDSGSAWWQGVALTGGGTTVSLLIVGTGGSFAQWGFINSTSPFTWAAGDAVDGLIYYRV
jgi:hypothetical protein